MGYREREIARRLSQKPKSSGLWSEDGMRQLSVEELRPLTTEEIAARKVEAEKKAEAEKLAAEKRAAERAAWVACLPAVIQNSKVGEFMLDIAQDGYVQPKLNLGVALDNFWSCGPRDIQGIVDYISSQSLFSPSG
jgi:hypothetical protein